MAESKGKGIQDLTTVSVEVDGKEGKIEIAPGVVQSVTTVVPHKADASSAPGPYDGLELNRPPVSTNRPDVPIAHSLVAGAGAPTGPLEYSPEDPNDVPSTAFVSKEDKENVVKMDDPAKPAK